MRSPEVFHPLFSEYPRFGLNTSMKDRIEILAPEATGAADQNWVPGVGIPDNNFDVVYRGYGRVQPNVDWRARDRNFVGELTATEAVRIQIPFNKNEIGGTEIDGVWTYGAEPFISKDYMVNVLSSEAPNAEWLISYTFMVRNAMQASEKWLRTFLADAGTKVRG